MFSGAETPTNSLFQAGAQSAPDSAVFVSRKTPLSSGTHNSENVPDYVELSSEARNRLEKDPQTFDLLQKGRGELAQQDADPLRDQLGQAKAQVDFLKGLAETAPADQQAKLKAAAEDLSGQLESLAAQDGLTSHDLTKAAKNFKELVDEFQKSLDDENRIPPSIFKQMQKLLEIALEPSKDKRIDKIA